mgnify:CR=1 FL=1
MRGQPFRWASRDVWQAVQVASRDAWQAVQDLFERLSRGQPFAEKRCGFLQATLSSLKSPLLSRTEIGCAGEACFQDPLSGPPCNGSLLSRRRSTSGKKAGG